MAVNRLLQRILAFRFRGDPPADWQPHLTELDFVKTLDGDERRRLVQLARMFESVVRFDSRHDLDVTERMIRLTALQACRLILGLGYEPYRHVHRVTFLPSTFVIESSDGHVRARGAADSGGHVALSWQETAAGMYDGDGRNVVYHEFAHVLDGYDGIIDGRPDVADDGRWADVVGRAFKRHKRRGKRRRRRLIDRYGATSPIEFFAEAVEVFFERPDELRQQQPQLYDALADYFKQDPAS